MVHQLSSKPLFERSFIEYVMIGILGLALMTGLAGMSPQLAAILALIPTGFMIAMAKRDGVRTNGLSYLVAISFALMEAFGLWSAFDGTTQGANASICMSSIVSTLGLLLLYMSRAEFRRHSKGLPG